MITVLAWIGGVLVAGLIVYIVFAAAYLFALWVLWRMFN